MISRLVTAVLLFFVSLAAWANSTAPSKSLAIDSEHVQKKEVRHSMIGYRDTLIFYVFNDQKAVLRLRIGNKDTTFPVTGEIYMFDDAVTAKGLAKWLNNQHSDGLYPDVPKPIQTKRLPANACKVISNTLIDSSEQRSTTYKNYSVKVRVKDYTDKTSVNLKGFVVESKVHVKQQ